MLVGAVAVGLLAIGESRARSEAVQELDDLEVLLVVREMQSGLAAEIGRSTKAGSPSSRPPIASTPTVS
ncbi:MAG: hypothetical protein R2710_00880 [Acidimicrobiales bacterium]